MSFLPLHKLPGRVCSFREEGDFVMVISQILDVSGPYVSAISLSSFAMISSFSLSMRSYKAIFSS